MERLNITTLIGFAVALVIAAGIFLSLSEIGKTTHTLTIFNFEECVAAGYPITPARTTDDVQPARTTDDVQSGGESYPEQCATPDGRTFVRDISNDEYLEPSGATVTGGCALAGCSSQLCVEGDEAADIITTCEFRPEYACYQQYGHCERQTSGQCGWTETTELEQCIAKEEAPPASPGSSNPNTVEVVF